MHVASTCLLRVLAKRYEPCLAEQPLSLIRTSLSSSSQFDNTQLSALTARLVVGKFLDTEFCSKRHATGMQSVAC